MTESSTPRGFRSGYPRASDDVKRCHHCGSDQHLLRDCEQAKRNQNTRDTFYVSEVENNSNTSDTCRVRERRNRDQGSNEMWSEFKAKLSRDNARANGFETNSQERG